MSQPVPNDLITKQILSLLKEVFVEVQGAILDRGTSLCETLDSLTAADASKPSIPGGTSIAGHTEHILFYLRVTDAYMEGRDLGKLDWKQSWLVHEVTESEWTDLRQQVRDYYDKLATQVNSFPDWNNEKRLGGCMANIAHTAFHIGAIRQIMKAVKG